GQWDFPYEIAVLDLTTGQVRRLTDNDNTNTFPTWSPDGTRLAFNAQSSTNAYYNLFVMDANGGNVQQLTLDDTRNVFPDWSPDGTQIVFQRGQPDISGIYTLSFGDTTLPMQISDLNANFLPEWEPYH
ncbi:MAG: DPP IV N-terminal domain-containing protein, partial [Anaerolineae bacterium]|nr:DPP IV N-terminal domain-containing protein [Anaerolineae bacterium]